MEQFAIGVNLESAAARRNERERFDAFAEFKNFGRQTDGLRRVVSNDAIFDRDLGLHPVSSFPTKMVGKASERVNREVGVNDSELTPALRRQLLCPALRRVPRGRKPPRTNPRLATCG